MFKHLLIATGGSERSRNAVERGLLLVRALGARVTALHVVPEFRRSAYQVEMPDETQDQSLLRPERRAEAMLREVRATAKQSGVGCDARFAIADQPYSAIVSMAAAAGCDLIVMASHGAKGLQGLLLGSETQKVLVHCSTPVLVFR